LAPVVLFGGHSYHALGHAKYEAWKANPGTNPFIDPLGYRQLMAARAHDFVEALRRQQAAASAQDRRSESGRRGGTGP
jgi:hypothetical protein